jgi:hypothetical protein
VFWIGILFALIMLADWFMQKKEGVRLKTRMIVLIISGCFLVISEVVFNMKEQWNLTILFQYLRETMLGRSF